jgi:hypothetical protein
MLALIGEHIDAPIGATTTATGHTAGRIAVTIQRTSGSATTDSGGITDSLTRRGGHAEGEAHQHFGSLTWRVLLRPVAPMSALGQKQTFASQKVMSALPPKADIELIGASAATPFTGPNLEPQRSLAAGEGAAQNSRLVLKVPFGRTLALSY